jgi:hypothetical protein
MTVINNRISVANDCKAEMEAKRAFLQELIKNDDLDEAALEITKQVIAEGEDGLTPAQKFAFQRYVLRKFVTQKCQNGCDISWSEQYEAPYHPSVFHACHSGGKGRQAWRILTMRRMPRVNQDVLPRATFAG